MLILPLLIFFAVTLGLSGLFLWLAPTRIEQRLQAISGPARKSQWTETAVQLVGPFANLSAPTGDWETSPLRIRFINAGIRYPDAHLIYLGAKTLLPLIFAAAAFWVFRGVS